MAGLLEMALTTLQGYFELGNDVEQVPRARLVTNARCPLIFDANCVTGIRAATDEEIEDVLQAAEQAFTACGHRAFKLDPHTPSSFEARLLFDGYRAETELQLLLHGPLQGVPAPVEIRPVVSDSDWEALLSLTRADHEEEALKENRACWEMDVTRQMLATKRAKGPELRFWLARAAEEDCAFFSSWPGIDGVGKVEDLFTRPVRHPQADVCPVGVRPPVRRPQLREAGRRLTWVSTRV